MNLYDYRRPYHYGKPLFGGHKARYKIVHRQRMERRKSNRNLHQILSLLSKPVVSVGYAGHAVIKYLVAANFHSAPLVRGEC